MRKARVGAMCQQLIAQVHSPFSTGGDAGEVLGRCRSRMHGDCRGPRTMVHTPETTHESRLDSSVRANTFSHELNEKVAH